jgi:hypothetical protein
MKLFNILLILAVAIIGAFASDQYSDQCITGCIEYGAIDCYGGCGIPIDHIFSVSDPVSILIVT